MNCRAFKEHLDDFVRGRAAEHISSALKTHLHDCRDCRTEYETHAALLALLDKQADFQLGPGELDDFVPAVLNNIDVKKAYRAWFYRLAPAVAVAVVLLVFVFGRNPKNELSRQNGGIVEYAESLKMYSSLIAAVFGNGMAQEIETAEQELESQGGFFTIGYEDLILSMGDEDLKKLESKLEELKNDKG